MSTADAYSATGEAWRDGPGRIYDRLAEVAVGLSPVSLAGRRALDLGAGTGAGSRAALAAAAAGIVAVDVSIGMLLVDRASRPPATVADAGALPFADRAFGAVVAPFSLNHVPDAVAALREAMRVTAPGGSVIASSYAADDTHPVKRAVEDALATRGWEPPAWYAAVRDHAVPALATVEGCRTVAAEAGLDAEIHAVRVPFPELTPTDLVAWRLGMAQTAPFVATVDREDLVADALAGLGAHPPPLERSILVIAGVR